MDYQAAWEALKEWIENRNKGLERVLNITPGPTTLGQIMQIKEISDVIEEIEEDLK